MKHIICRKNQAKRRKNISKLSKLKHDTHNYNAPMNDGDQSNIE